MLCRALACCCCAEWAALPCEAAGRKRGELLCASVVLSLHASAIQQGQGDCCLQPLSLWPCVIQLVSVVEMIAEQRCQQCTPLMLGALQQCTTHPIDHNEQRMLSPLVAANSVSTCLVGSLCSMYYTCCMSAHHRRGAAHGRPSRPSPLLPHCQLALWG